MRALLALVGLAGLMLLAGCAQRTYVVFPPDRAAPRPVNSCVLDFSEIQLRRWTVAQIEKWKTATGGETNCGGLELVYHRPGERLKGDGFRPPDDYVVVGIGLDSRPERPALEYPPIIRAIVEPPPIDPPPIAWVCPDGLRCVPPDQGCTRLRCPRIHRVIGRLVIPLPDLSFEVPEPPPRPPEPDDDPPDEPRDPPIGDDDSDKDKKAPRQPGEPGTLEEALPPALVGGGLVYALALMKMLPFVGSASSGPFRSGPGPSWGSEDVRAPGPAAPSGGENARPRDPRVRVSKAGFEDSR